MTYKTNDIAGLTENAVALPDARKSICAWEQASAGWNPAEHIKPNSFFIPLPDLENLLALIHHYHGVGARAYLSVVDNEGFRQSRLLLVACKEEDGEKKDVVEPIEGTDGPLYTIYDLTSPCPPLCKGRSSHLIAPCPEE